MAVYTSIDAPMLEDFLSAYDVGELTDFKGIAQGVSNTNYHVFTTQGRYILTIFEEHRTRAEDLPFFFDFSDHLQSQNIPCPSAIKTRDGEQVKTLSGKAAALVRFVEGKELKKADITPDACAQMGTFAGKMHKAAESFKTEREDLMGFPKWRALFEKIKANLEAHKVEWITPIAEELDWLDQNWPKDLPSGAIHCDLFPDNVFFKDGQISAVIDPYLACTSLFLYDLAIIINSWCFDETCIFFQDRYEALLEGYERIRPLSPEEHAALPIIARAAATRFLLSRLEELYAHTDDTLMTPHDPGEYWAKLEFHKNQGLPR